MFNTQFFTIVMAFIGMIAGSLSKQLQSDIASGNTTLDDQILEVKKEISGGGTVDLIDGTTERVDGICSFDKNRLNSGRAFIFDRVSILYKADAASGKEGELLYDSAAPAALRNALFIINQDGREVLRIPVRDLNNIHSGNTNADDYCTLNSLRYLADERNISIQIKFPPNVALDGATKHYVYVRLAGLQTTKKPSA